MNNTKTESRRGGGIAGFSINNGVISWIITLALLIGGIIEYFNLGQLEDPDFTIKNAVIVTLYPGASPQQVEEEVTQVLENALQKMKRVDYIASTSGAGYSRIDFWLPRDVSKDDVQQIWDDLRRKINDIQGQLPSGAQKPLINDDFGDVYGMLMGITADGFGLEDISDYTDFLKRELLLVSGVGKVAVLGEQQEQIFIEVERAKIANQGITFSSLARELADQDVVSNAGDLHVGEELVRFHPTGEYQSLDDLRNTIITPTGSKTLIRLSDVARVYKGVQDKPTKLIRVNGQAGLTLGISFAPGVNVVNVGQAVKAHLQLLERDRPHGMEYEFIYDQPTLVDHAVKGFLQNLLEACAIIFIVLLISMGLKAGVLISSILVITISGTFILMEMAGIQLQRISLGALIIALGMLIDNAIVIVEGLIIGMEKGKSKFQATVDITRQTQFPLLAATVIAIVAFAPIGLSQDATGEILGSLFWVLNFSLFLSWITAVTITPFFCDKFYKDGEFDHGESDQDPYSGVVFRVFKTTLDFSMRFPKATCVFLVVALFIAGNSFKLIKPEFFPPSTTTQFQLDLWADMGTDIRTMNEKVAEFEAFLMQYPQVHQVASSIGDGHTRFMLPYKPEQHFDSYANLLIKATSVEELVPLIQTINRDAALEFPELTLVAKRFSVGPQTRGAIELRISGPDPAVLRQFAEQAKAGMREVQQATAIRDDWYARTKVVRPVYDEINGRRLGISKRQLDQIIKSNFSGRVIGRFKDGTTTMPIVFRPPEEERVLLSQLDELNVWSPVKQDFVQITQVVKEFALEFEDPFIQRRDRRRTITVLADYDVTGEETAASVRAKMVPFMDQLQQQLPTDYTMEWGGKHEKSTTARESVLSTIPAGYLFMFILTILLFNSLKDALIIWLVVPLSIIGVVGGLLTFNMPFTFMTLLGTLSLTGMMCRNGIVLIDQIRIYIGKGMDPYQAVFDGAVSRVRPVALTAVSSIMGMIPLLQDAFFAAMAAAMMVGLFIATLLILIAVPVLYCLIYRIQYQPMNDQESQPSMLTTGD